MSIWIYGPYTAAARHDAAGPGPAAMCPSGAVLIQSDPVVAEGRQRVCLQYAAGITISWQLPHQGTGASPNHKPDWQHGNYLWSTREQCLAARTGSLNFAAR